MCKSCKKVFSIVDMTDGYCQNCATATDEMRKKIEDEVQQKSENSIGFEWWKIQGWLGLTVGNLVLLEALKGTEGIAFTFILVNTVLMILILQFNKYAFLIATIFKH